MIDYTYDLLVPANTLQSNPATSEVRLGQGRLEQVYINFPEGCGTMVHVCIEYRGFQFAPIINNQSYHLDNYTLSIDTEQVLNYEPFAITLKGWSPNTKYDHTIGFVLCVSADEENNDLANLVNLLAVKHV